MQRWGKCSCLRVKFNEHKEAIVYYKDDCLVCNGTGYSGDAKSYLQRELDQEWERERILYPRLNGDYTR